MNRRRLQARDYTVGWICALPIELAAAQEMLDEDDDPPQYNSNCNLYTFGRIGDHNVVLTCLPAGQIGPQSAATIATRMTSEFASIRFGLMVGIGGGVPSAGSDIRLGDVVISQPFLQHGGVVQYDFGKTGAGGHKTRTGWLNAPPAVLLNAVSKLRALHCRGQNNLATYLSIFNRLENFSRNTVGPDVLFEATYNHIGGATCEQCSKEKEVKRTPRKDQEVVVHYGTIASGNQVVKDGVTRDRISAELGGVMCFEMEAAGLMNDFPCLVVRGICDYADSHKNKKWQLYAAATAAACAKEILSIIPAARDEAGHGQNIGSYQTPFSLLGVPKVNEFVDRPSDIAELEQALLPQGQYRRQKVFVLYGLGGMGKTQLAVEFARRHRQRFSSVFWLDGRTEDSLKQSIATCASRIPEGQIAASSRTYSATSNGDINAVVRDVMSWLSLPDNIDWLIIFDNVDRDSQGRDADPDGYNVTSYFSGADHGSILITTRLANLEQLGVSRRLGKLSKDQTQAMFQQRYRGSCDAVEREALLKLLDGLPLAIAQAASYLRQNGIGVGKYIKLYEEQWKGLMESQDRAGTPLRDYPERSVWTTWMISYHAIRAKSIAAANLLLLWACLDNKDVWYGLLAEAGKKSTDVANSLSEWLPDIASNEVEFLGAIQLLRSYSLVEDVQDLASYTTHPVVHRWAFHMQDEEQQVVFTRLAVVVVGWAVPDRSEKEHATVQRRLLPHAQRCWQREVDAKARWKQADASRAVGKQDKVMLDAIHWLGRLYNDQGKLNKAEEMYQRALEGKEKALGQEHISTLSTVNNLGVLYSDQGKLDEAEKMYQKALEGYEGALGLEHALTLNTVNNLGALYSDQGKLDEAEKMYQRALEGKEKALGREHISTLDTVNNLGLLYADQGKLDKAEKMYQRALEGYEGALGQEHTSTLSAVNNLGNLYRNQGKLDKAEKMYQRALEGKEKALGREHTSTLHTVNNLGLLYTDQGKLDKAEKIYQRALEGYEKALGREHASTLNTVNSLGALYSDQGKLDEAEKMYQRALEGRENVLGQEHTSTLDTVNNLSILYAGQGKLDEAEKMYQRVLEGYEKALGREHTSTLYTVNNLGNLYRNQGKLNKAEKMYQRALEGKEKALGQQHTSTLDTVNNLGNLYRNQGKLDEAEKMYQRALEGYEKALGQEHISTLSTVNNLGALYSDQGKLGEAEKMYQRALEGREKALGREHTSTLDTVNNLGNLYRDQGKLGEAEKMYQRALEGKEKALGREHASTLNTVSNLGALYSEQGKLDEAEKICQQALEGYEKALGREHTSTLNTVNNLGSLYRNQGKLDEAEKMYQRALEGYEKALGQEHASTLDMVNNLGALYSDQGKLGEAEKMYQRALEGKEKALGREHTSTLNTVNNLGLLYAGQGKLDEAGKMYWRALEGYEKALGREHTSTLNTVNNLGNLYSDQGKLDEAEKMYQQALEGYEKALSPEKAAFYIPALNTVYNLGILFASRGDVDRARAMYSRALAGYQKVAGHDDLRCQKLHDLLSASQTSGKTDVLADAEADGMHTQSKDISQSVELNRISLPPSYYRPGQRPGQRLGLRLGLLNGHRRSLLPLPYVYIEARK